MIDSLAYHLYMLENIPWKQTVRITKELDTNTVQWYLQKTGMFKKKQPKEIDEYLPINTDESDSPYKIWPSSGSS